MAGKECSATSRNGFEGRGNVLGRISWQAARRVGGALCVLCVVAASVGATGGQKGDIGGYARCGEEYVEIPASAGDPDSWTDAQREEVRQAIEESYSVDELKRASVRDPVIDERAAEQGLFVVECADIMPSLETEENWTFEHDSFMD